VAAFHCIGWQHNIALDGRIDCIQQSIRSAVIGKRFRSAELPGLYELEAFVNEISPAVRSKLAWLINKSLGLDTNAIRQLLEDKSIAEEWLRFEQESK